MKPQNIHFGLEVTMAVGCSNHCLKYCPQEVLVQRYGNNDRIMTVKTFQMILANTPKQVDIVFSGFNEPFDNRNCIDCMKLAGLMGHTAMKKKIERM